MIFGIRITKFNLNEITKMAKNEPVSIDFIFQNSSFLLCDFKIS